MKVDPAQVEAPQMPKTNTTDHDSILGLPTEEIAGLKADELENNPTAIKMMLHYYKRLGSENTALKNELNTLKTYVAAYESSKVNTSIGSILLALSNISIGFGVSLLSESKPAGWCSMIIGLALIAAGMYFNFFRRESR